MAIPADAKRGFWLIGGALAALLLFGWIQGRIS
jgi:hypothetical protein